MKLIEPTSVEAALSALAAEPEARPLAGGATLVAMMNADLLAPAALISLDRIDALTGITSQADGALRIGAMTRHATVAASPHFAAGQRVVSLAAGRIGHPAIRNMGTIGGSICHADPSADYPTALVCAGAEVEIAGPDGTRRVPAAEFFLGYFETDLAPGELVTAVIVPPAPAGSRAAYTKFTRADGDFATVSVAMVLTPGADGIDRLAVAIGGCAGAPVRVPEAEALLSGQPPDSARIAEAGRLLAAACDPMDDVRGSAAYRLRLVPRLFRRTLEELMEP